MNNCRNADAHTELKIKSQWRNGKENWMLLQNYATWIQTSIAWNLSGRVGQCKTNIWINLGSWQKSVSTLKPNHIHLE